MSNKCQKLPSSALSRLLAHIEKHTIAQLPHWEGFCMSGEAISTAAYRIINDALRTSRRRFLTQVGAAGLGIGCTNVYDDSAGNAAFLRSRWQGGFPGRETCSICDEPPI